MSADGVLNDRKLRRLRQTTGVQTIVRAWAWHPVTEFVTADHRHGWYNRQTEEVGWYQTPTCYTSCHELFPDGPA